MIPYKQGCVVMEKGDVLLMFTDGVNEAMDEDNKEFGDDRLKGVLCDHAHLSSNEILNVIVRDIKQHAGKAPQSDDITLLVIKAVE
ncbi:MAG: serine/threonine-protein phosphatase [Candidatus Kapabacteria bacterium]|nr:serine/threonine-protein phosphatase [Candidatus Kapabacteria bacterium]